MIIDCHYHLERNLLPDDELLKKMDGLFDYSFIKRRVERLFPDTDIQNKLLGENFLELIQN